MVDTSGWPNSSAALNELGDTCQLGYVVAVGLANISQPKEEFQKALQTALDVTAHNLERHLTGFGVVASICPLLGILGTVVGLIEVFRSTVRRGTDRRAIVGWRYFYRADHHGGGTFCGYSSAWFVIGHCCAMSTRFCSRLRP